MNSHGFTRSRRSQASLSCEPGANARVAKPARVGRCRAMVRAIGEVWCGARSPLRP